MLSIKETTYGNFGKCLLICNDSMEMIVTVDLGPRIIKCNLKNKNNLMFEDIERSCQSDVSDLFGKGKVFQRYGGHRMYFLPENSAEIRYPESEKVLYSTNASGASFTAPIQEHTALRFSMSIAANQTKPICTIVHRVQNAGKTPVTGTLCCATAFRQNGTLLFPRMSEGTNMRTAHLLSFSDETDLTDERIILGKQLIALRQNTEKSENIHLGINNTAGKLAYSMGEQTLVKTFPAHISECRYAELGTSSAAHLCPFYTEAETLSPITTLGAGESISYEETWTLVSGVELEAFSKPQLEPFANVIF